MRKRILSVILAIVMVVGIIPFGMISAFATTSTELVPDENLRKEINKTLTGTESTASLTKEQLSKVTRLFVTYDVTTYKGLEYCTNLTGLTLFYSKGDLDVSLENNTKLQMFWSCGIQFSATAINSLKSLKSLYLLDLEGMVFTEESIPLYRSAFSTMTWLTKLCLASTNLDDSNVSMLDPLVNLDYLVVNYTDITKLDFITKHKDKLKDFTCRGTDVSDATPIKECKSLESLGLNNTQIHDFSVFNALPNICEFPPREGSDSRVCTNYATASQVIENNVYTLKNDIVNQNGTFVTNFSVYCVKVKSGTMTTVNKIDEKPTDVATLNGSVCYYYDKTKNMFFFYNIPLDSYEIEINATVPVKSVNGKYSVAVNVKRTHTLDIMTTPIIESIKGNKGYADFEDILLEGEIAKRGDYKQFTYQWYKDGQMLLGQTGINLTVRDAGKRQSGTYTLKAYSRYGSVSEKSVDVKVYDRGDVNMDGEINIMDVTYIQAIVAKDIEYTYLQERLGDYCEDGSTTVMDASSLQFDLLK